MSLEIKDPKQLKKLQDTFSAMKEKASKDPVYFADTFLFMFDPKNEPHNVQFKTFDFQKRLMRNLVDHIRNGEDIFIEKCREMGATYTVLAVFLWMWLFEPSTSFLVGSRKEDYVDNRRGGLTGNKEESLFGKLDYMITRLPDFMKPEGWNKNRYFNYMSLLNPANGNVISGESSNPNFSRGGRHTCVVGSTQVLTGLGVMTIKEAHEKNINTFINPSGEEVKVLSYIKRLPEPLLKVKTRYGFELTGTLDHPVQTENGIKKLKDLTKNDEIRLSLQSNTNNTDLISKEMAMIMGLLVSEGYINHYQKIGFCNKDKWLIDFYIELFKKEFNLDLGRFLRKVERTYPDGKTNFIYLIEKSDKKAREILLERGLKKGKALAKEIPYSVLQSSKEVQKVFLQALFEGDGCVSRPKSLGNRLVVSYNSISEKLVRQLQSLLLTYGIISAIKSQLRENRDNRIYTLQINGYYAKKFCDEIGFLSERKNSVSKGYKPSGIINQFSYYRKDQSNLFLPILDISQADSEITYDVSLESKDHLFISNGLVSHNCILLDEFAFWLEGNSTWGSTADTTNCRIVLTTPGSSPSKAKRLRFGKDGEEIDIVTLNYHLDPRKSPQWLTQQKKRRSKEDFAREIMIDWELSITGRVYPEVEGAKLGDFPFIPGEHLYCSWDFGLDGTALLFWQRNRKNGKWRLIDSYFNQDRPIQFYLPFFGLPKDSKYTYSPDDLDAIERISSFPSMIHFGDPDVKKRAFQSDAISTKSVLAENGIYVQSVNAKTWEFRRDRTKVFLKDGLEIDKHSRNEFALECFKYDRYKERSPDVEYTSPPQRVHGIESHMATAMEYMAVNVDAFTNNQEENAPNWATEPKRWLTSKLRLKN
jgi:intein/homing endonuclease